MSPEEIEKLRDQGLTDYEIQEMDRSRREEEYERPVPSPSYPVARPSEKPNEEQGLTDEQMSAMESGDDSKGGLSDEQMDALEQASKAGIIDHIKAGVFGVGQGLTFNMSDEMMSGVKAGAGALTGQGKFSDLYNESQKGYEDFERQANQKSFYPYQAGELAGGAAQMAVAPLRALAAPAGMAMKQAAPRVMTAGALAGYGASPTGTNTEDQVTNMAIGAGAGLGIEAGTRAVPAIWRTLITGIKPKTHAYYIKNIEAVENASPGKLTQDVSEAYNQIKNDAGEYKQVTEDAKSSFDSAKENLFYNLRQKDIPPELVEKLGQANKLLSIKNSQDSSRAFDVLSAQKVSVNMSPARQFLREEFKGFKIQGEIPPSLIPEAKKVVQWHTFLSNKEKLTAVELKQMIQLLDSDLSPAWEKMAQGGKPTAGEKSLMNFRRYLNDYIGNLPGYEDVMAPLRENAKLSGAIEGMFDNPNSTRSMLRKIAIEGRPEDRELIRKVGSAIGEDFLAPLADYKKSQNTLNNPDARKLAVDSLPEKTAYDSAQAQSLGTGQFLNEMAPFSDSKAEHTLRGLRIKDDQEAKMYQKNLLGQLEQYSGKDFQPDLKNVGIKEAINAPFRRGSGNINQVAFSMQGVGGLVAKALGLDVPVTQGAFQGAGALLGGMNDVEGLSLYRFVTKNRYNPQYKKYIDSLSNGFKKSILNGYMTHKLLLSNYPDYNNAVNEQDSNDGEVTE